MFWEQDVLEISKKKKKKRKKERKKISLLENLPRKIYLNEFFGSQVTG